MGPVVLQTPPKSSHPTQLLSRQHFVRVSPLAATLMNSLASVANKRVTAWLSPLDATLTKNRGRGVLWLTSHSAKKHPSMNSLVFMQLRTLFLDGSPVGLFFSVTSALFSSRRRVLGGLPQSTFNFQLSTIWESPLTAPATLFHPWLANASASISSPIFTGAKKSPAPFASLRIPPRPFRRMTNTAGSKSAQDTAK